MNKLDPKEIEILERRGIEMGDVVEKINQIVDFINYIENKYKITIEPKSY
jgi:hypothetical protein